MQVRFEAELQDVRSKVERIVGELAVGAKGSTGINRALLYHIDTLAVFLGRRLKPLYTHLLAFYKK